MYSLSEEVPIVTTRDSSLVVILISSNLWGTLNLQGKLPREPVLSGAHSRLPAGPACWQTVTATNSNLPLVLNYISAI